MRRLHLIAAFSALSLGIVHCVADDPTDVGTGDQGDASTNGDSTTTGDGSNGGDGATNNDGSPGVTDACLATPANCPSAIESTSLKLWLRGNVGVTCTAGRVARWIDQSISGNDGVPANFQNRPFNTVAVAPQCGTEKIAAHDVVTFTAPAQDASVGAPFLDETLAVNLGWVVNSNYTFFVVHQRKADATFGLVAQDMGTDASDTWTCSPIEGISRPTLALALGFQNLTASVNPLYHAQHCIVGDGRDFGSLTEYDAGTFTSGATEIDEVVHDATSGNQLYANGTLLASTATTNDKHDIEAFFGTDAGLQGYVGRASEDGFDTRYQGDIAEVIGYANALSDDERGQIEAYLKLQWGLTF